MTSNMKVANVATGVVALVVVNIFYYVVSKYFNGGPFLPVLAGSAASFLVGFIWYHPNVFGRVWWRLEFPGKKFGQCNGSMFIPLTCTFAVEGIQNTVVSAIMNTIQSNLYAGPSTPGFELPLLCAVSLIIVVGCASLPHYLFGERYIGLYAIALGHDAAQIALGTFVMYAMMKM